MRLNPIFNIRSLPLNISISNAPYFEHAIDIIRNMLHIRGFPNISPKVAYEHLLERNPPLIQQKYQLSNWKNIRSNLNFNYIPVRTRDVLFKYLHGILPNKYRLKHVRRSASNLCDFCHVPETNKHMMYQCQEISEVKNFLIRLLDHFEFRNVNMSQLILLDIPKTRKQTKNAVILVTSLYISSIWYGRSNKPRILGSLKSIILREKQILEEILKEKFTDTFIEPFYLLNRNSIDRM